MQPFVLPLDEGQCSFLCNGLLVDEWAAPFLPSTRHVFSNRAGTRPVVWADDTRVARDTMQRVLDIRITRWYFKLLYVVGAWLVGFPVSGLLTALNAPALVGSLLSTAITLASVIVGARVFRGRGEPVAPRRSWWKMTARPLLSRVLGTLFVLSLASTLLLVITATLGVDQSAQSLGRMTILDTTISVVLSAVLAFLYLNSAVRLAMMPAPVREPKFKPRLKLK